MYYQVIYEMRKKISSKNLLFFLRYDTPESLHEVSLKLTQRLNFFKYVKNVINFSAI